MRNTTYLKSVNIIIIIILMSSCNNLEKDWKKAQSKNSIDGYKDFVQKYSTSIYARKAQYVCDSLAWDSAIIMKKSFLLENLLKNYSTSDFLRYYKIPLDSLEWNIANFASDTVKLRNYIRKYPNSLYKIKAEENIWDLQWPPLDIFTQSIIIHSKGGSVSGGNAYCGYSEDGLGMILLKPTVEIWRDFTPKEKQEFSKIGLIIGVAYTKLDGKYVRIKHKIDLKKSNDEICSEFGFPPVY